MAKKTNCRNCKWALWMKTEAGRNRYGNYAECTYPVIVKLPASRTNLETELCRKVGVYEHSDIQVLCDAWEPIPFWLIDVLRRF